MRYLNTSNVNVNQCGSKNLTKIDRNLNTSNVNVNRKRQNRTSIKSKFKYIQC